MKSVLTLAILSSIAATPAMAERFTRDGVTYSYNVKAEEGSRLISGTILSSGQAFRLRLKDGRVSGRVGGRFVQFDAPADETAANAQGNVLAVK